MIIVKIYGGLANQMFQYALYKSLLFKSKEAYTDTISFVPTWGFDDVRLSETFPNLKINNADIDIIKKFSIDRSLLNRVRKLLRIHKKTHYFEPTYHYNPAVFDLKANYYIEGYWQTEKYFNDIKNEIRKDFMFRNFDDKRNIDLLHKLQNEESVCIHVRKGPDYKKSITAGACEIDYYNRAIDLIKEKIGSPSFYVFTDNKEWVKDMFKNFKYTLIDWNPVSGPLNYLDMQLMSNCKHNIIANSSYSWWGAWLNQNPDKIVIGPKIWFAKKNIHFDSSDILPKNWIAL